MRIIHLVELPAPTPRRRWLPEAGDGVASMCAGVVRELAEFEHMVVGIGGGHGARRAEALGLALDARVAPPLGSAPGAWRALARSRLRPDAVVAWGLGAAVAGAMGLPDVPARIAVIASMHGLRGRASIALVRRALRGTATIACSDEDSRLLRSLHGAPVRIASPSSPRDHVDRDVTRRMLRVLPDQLLIALLGDPPSSADAFRFVFTIGFLDRAEFSVVGLIPSGAGELRRTRRLHLATAQSMRLIVTDRPLSTLLRACDMAVWEGGLRTFGGQRPAPTGLDLWIQEAALAQGVPVVVAPSATSTGRVGCSFFQAHGVGPSELARQLLPLAVDPALRAAAPSRVEPGGSDLARALRDLLPTTLASA